MTPREHVLTIRVAVLEQAIRTHRQVVRDGWRSRWRPDRTDRPDETLWEHVDE